MKKIGDKTALKGVALQNRIFRSATWEGLSDGAGKVTDAILALYDDLASGGPGAIITGFAYICADEQANVKMLGAYDDSLGEGFLKLTSLIHGYDVPVILQIAYGGANTVVDPAGRTILTASGVEHPVTGISGREATKEELSYLSDCFAAAVLRAKNWGFDGAQIHCAHDYALNEFMSRRFNKRTDEYGGSIENRARLLVEIIRKAREKAGNDFLLGMKINSVDGIDEGLELWETVEICKMAEKAGLDFIEVSGGSKNAKPGLEAIRAGVGKTVPEGYYKNEAAEISRAVKIPVISVGGYRSKKAIEEALNTGNIEYVSMARPFICESDIVKRLLSGQEKSACISCPRCYFYEHKTCVLKKDKA